VPAKTKADFEAMTVDQLNAETERLEAEEAEIREWKRFIAAVRAERVAYDAKVVRLARLKPEEVEEMVSDEALRADVLAYQRAAAARPAARAAQPGPARVGAAVPGQ
jgi:uncharacterized protein (UPF0335 family)